MSVAEWTEAHGPRLVDSALNLPRRRETQGSPNAVLRVSNPSSPGKASQISDGQLGSVFPERSPGQGALGATVHPTLSLSSSGRPEAGL